MDGWPMYNKICISKPWEVKTRRVQDLCFLDRSIDIVPDTSSKSLRFWTLANLNGV